MEAKQSKAIELLQFVWRNENTNSYSSLNDVMRGALRVAINSLMKFDKDDVNYICDKLGGGYWLYANDNGKGIGDSFYSNAVRSSNMSFCQSYEAYYNFKPFISAKGKRMHTDSLYRDNNRRYSVTGFDFETKRIYLVSYDISDWEYKGKKQLHNFDNKEWNVFRKQIEEF